MALGKVSVDYGTQKDRLLKITSENSQAIAEAHAGKFVIQSAGGHVAVATTDGEVSLTAEEETVVVGPNSVSGVAPGKAPEQPIPSP